MVVKQTIYLSAPQESTSMGPVSPTSPGRKHISMRPTESRHTRYPSLADNKEVEAHEAVAALQRIQGRAIELQNVNSAAACESAPVTHASLRPASLTYLPR